MPAEVWLRDVEPGDVAAYVAMRCDPQMMADLGGPLPRDGIEAKVSADMASVRSGGSWILMIVPDPADPGAVAGSVVLWSHPDDHEPADAAGRPADVDATAGLADGASESPADGDAAQPVGTISEVGWMVLPAFQGQSMATRAVSQLLDRAAADGRWGTVHAFPAVTNAASNGVCRSLGFSLVGTVTVDYVGRPLTCHHWQVEPGHHRRRPAPPPSPDCPLPSPD